MHVARLAVSASILAILAAASGCAPVDSIDLDAIKGDQTSSATGSGGSGGAGGAPTSATGSGGAGGATSSATGTGGGAPAGTVADGGACTASAECVSGVCDGTTCQVPSCSDGVANGGESGVDCGLGCAATDPLLLCPSGAACGSNADCYNGRCEGDVCGPSLLGDWCLTQADCADDLRCDRDVTGKCQPPPSCANDLKNQVVISQIYGGGGVGGSPAYASDFVELHNRGESAENLADWSIQVASATGSAWTTIALSGTLPGGGFYLVKLGVTGSGPALPSPDVTDPSATDVPEVSGKVALLRAVATLSGECPTSAAIADLVLYGAASACASPSAVPALSATTSARRKQAGTACLDTDAGSDFSVGSPVSPRSGATTPVVCSNDCTAAP